MALKHAVTERPSPSAQPPPARVRGVTPKHLNGQTLVVATPNSTSCG